MRFKRIRKPLAFPFINSPVSGRKVTMSIKKIKFSDLKIGQSFKSMMETKYIKTSKEYAVLFGGQSGWNIKSGDEPVWVEVPEISKVLIYVKGGVAEFVTEGDVEVQLADQDDADHDDQGHDLLPKSFAKMAKQFNLPVQGD